VQSIALCQQIIHFYICKLDERRQKPALALTNAMILLLKFQNRSENVAFILKEILLRIRASIEMNNIR
jgi:hypothetical protein